MRSTVKLLGFVLTALFPVWLAEAQAPQLQRDISMKMALAIVEGASERCATDGYTVSVVVLGRAGDLVAALRGDGTKPHMLEFARLKAYTADTNPRDQTSLQFKKSSEERPYLKQIPGIVFIGGGVPIKWGDDVIGAVGVSGAPGEEKDEACALAGIAKVADALSARPRR
jgi:uncharacterized protein GlcG (DUF336 family)